ncbi:hypothetical protein [Neobacillus cucumis]|uniref:hypothetical protein n=1 Tax=Neobacillus cucumis TaxID=1740721 RepID=UPI002E24F919|nr:DUF927 domain-containing protein [Neobacillus cucumis]
MQAKQHIQAITKNIKNERDIQRKGGLYHIIPKIEYYLDLLSGYEDFSPEGRIDNYILIQRFIGKEIYPIYKAALEKEMEGGIPMSESWMEALKKKAQEAQAPYLLAINADLQSKEEPQQEDKRYLPSPMKDIVIPKGFEAREEGLYFVPDKDEKPPVFICSEYVLITGRYGNITHGTEGLIVSWFQDNKWKKLKRSRDNFMVQSKLVELSAFGFPVSSLNQRLMVQYLTALERANLENILHLRV